MQLKQKNNHIVKFFTVDKGTSVVVFAVAFRREGEELIAISEPKLIRIIEKKITAISGDIFKNETLLLPGISIKVPYNTLAGIPSPYLNPDIITKTGAITWQGARPPTKEFIKL